ncbi:MAG: hypothetical protein KF681_00005, partial [Bdellovibrionaceae bacterium]|nr:hypothetical protein [Pseudobdellovibrionaceae bacterium]
GVVGCDTLTNILGYTPANGTNYVAKAGDTMTGALNLPSNGLAVGTNQLVVSGGSVGIGTASPQSALHVNGSIQFGDDGSACPGAGNVKLGAMRYNTGKVQVCRSTGWTQLGGSTASSFAGYIGGGSIGAGSTNFSGYTKEFDVGGTDFNAATGVFTAPSSGQYLFTGMSHGVTASSNWYIQLLVNGSGASYYGSRFNPGGTNPMTNLSYVVNLNAGDTVQLQIINDVSASSVLVRFSGSKLDGGTIGGGSADNLGNGIATSNITLGNYWLSGSGGASGLRIDSSGNVGVGLATPTERLDVSGKIKGTELCIGADCRSSWPTGAGGTVTSVTSANADISVATTTTTPVLTLNAGTGANQILKLNGSGALPAVSGANLTSLNASSLASGTVPTSQLPTVPVSKGGTGSTSLSPNRLVASDGTGASMGSFFCAAGEVPKFDVSGVLGCATISTLLGYTPANGSNYVAKTGDTMTGTLTLASNGLVVGSNQLVVSGDNVGVGAASSSEKLEVAGAIKIGTTSGTQDGTIRWNGTDFQGRAGGTWKSMTGASTTSPLSFSVHRNGVDQTVTNGGWSKVLWTTVDFDTNSNFASSRYTPALAGKYLFSGQAYCSDNTAHCSVALYKNGVQVTYSFGRTTSAAPTFSQLIDMNGTTDYVEVYVYNSGGTTLSGNKTLTYLNGFLTSSSTTASSGSGTSNTIPVWGSSNTLGNSPLTVSSGNVGLGTAAPGGKLDVVVATGTGLDTDGTVNIQDGQTNQQRLKLGVNTAGNYSYIQSTQTNVTQKALALNPLGGNVGIGTAAPTAKLEVAGDIKATGGGTVGATRVIGTWGSASTNIPNNSYTYVGDYITLPAGNWTIWYDTFYDHDGTGFTASTYNHPVLSTSTSSANSVDNGGLNGCTTSYCPIKQMYFVSPSTTTTYYVIHYINSYAGSWVRIRAGWGHFFAIKAN